jgi:nicotinamide mononucleotide (NMN) deamidase PncC
MMNHYYKHVVAVTGGGSEIFHNLLSHGGASSWFIEGIIPYSKASLIKFLGYEPEKFCSSLTARQMAMAAFKRAIELGSAPDNAIGIGCTAALAHKKGNEEREGRKHHFYIARQSKTSSVCFSFLLNDRTLLEREAQEMFVAKQIYSVVTCNQCYGYSKIEDVQDEYNCGHLIYENRPAIVHCLGIRPDKRPIIYPGSFNPIHCGHLDVINWSIEYLNRRPYIELSVSNPDKPSLDYIDIKTRMTSINNLNITSRIAGVILSNTPRFVDKSYRYISPIFIVGVDTYNRIFNAKYYDDHEDLLNFVGHCKANDTKFYVLDRKGHTPYNYYVERYNLERIVNFVPKEQYEDRDGVSSTQIRRKNDENAVCV